MLLKVQQLRGCVFNCFQFPFLVSISFLFPALPFFSVFGICWYSSDKHLSVHQIIDDIVRTYYIIYDQINVIPKRVCCRPSAATGEPSLSIFQSSNPIGQGLYSPGPRPASRTASDEKLGEGLGTRLTWDVLSLQNTKLCRCMNIVMWLAQLSIQLKFTT